MFTTSFQGHAVEWNSQTGEINFKGDPEKVKSKKESCHQRDNCRAVPGKDGEILAQEITTETKQVRYQE